MKNRSFPARAMVPVLMNGVSMKIDALSISDWTKHHGTTAAGAKVNSLATIQVGDSTIIRTGDKVLSVQTDELEVMSVDTLKKLGYQITAPQKTGH